MTATSDILPAFEQDLGQTTTLEQLEAVNTTYLGRNGRINELLARMKDVPAEHKKAFGQEVNELKQEVIRQIEERKSHLITTSDEQAIASDPTLPGSSIPRGSIHMTSAAIEEITDIFAKIGFIRESYPEVDWEWYAFDALNIPPDHPARDDVETFFVKGEPVGKWGRMVLTPHTSNGQVREMERLHSKPPIRMINIGRTYRPNWDPSHVPMFHQFEGMCIDRGITISHLKGTIDYFVKELFGPTREIRLRPFHFQFTEPSFEVDITCGICNGTGLIKQNGNGDSAKCKLCKAGWLELGGSGMVHPHVLRAGGIDPEEYTGWAFGFGVERVFMMREGLNIDDLRTIYSGDVRFLEQF